MRACRLLRELTFGAVPPRGWGMAWYEPQRRVKVYAPIPMHRVARWIRETSWRLQIAVNAPCRERQESWDLQRRMRESQTLAQEYARGYLAGWRECREACLEAAQGGGDGRAIDLSNVRSVEAVAEDLGADHELFGDPAIFVWEEIFE